MKFIRPGRALAVAAIAMLGLSACGGGDAETNADGETQFVFTLATGALENTPHAAIQDVYLDLVEEKTDGRVTFDRTSFEAICKMQEVVECVRDGRADIGTTVPDYTPQLFPPTSVVGISFLNTDIQATTAALYDMHQPGTVGGDLMDSHGLHYVSNWPVGTLFIGSNRPVNSMADLEGLKARASGVVTQDTLQNAGMNINAITAAETYESVERGVIDSVAAALDFGVNYRINEILPYWTDPGLGQYSSYGMWWSANAYESLPDDLRALVDEATDELNAGLAIDTFNETSAEVCEGMLNAPNVTSFTRWDDAATEEWKSAVGTSGEEVWIESAEGYGMTDAPGYLADFKAAYASHASPDNPQDATAECVDRWQG